MSKNMTRKGLAFGAGVSLLGASLVGLPAQAAGIQNDAVVLKDTLDYGNYKMLTTGYIDISASFSGLAQSGSELKFYVSDRDAISVVDNDQQGSNVDTVATPTLTAYAELQGATDQLVLGFASASGIEDGDAIDGEDTLAITSADADAVALLAAPSQVEAVTEIAAGAMTSFSSTAKANDNAAEDVTFTITKAAHGISVGDIILIASTNVGTIDTDTNTEYNSDLDGYHVVTAAATNTFSFVVTTGTDTVGNTAQTDEVFTAGTVAVHNVRVNMDNTTSMTADS